MINLNIYILEKLHLNKDIKINEKEMMLIMYKGEGSSFDKVFYNAAVKIIDLFEIIPAGFDY